MRRFPEIAERLARQVAQTDKFFVDSSNLASPPARSTPADRDAATVFMRIVLIGLTDGETTDHRGHRCAIDGVMLLLRGELVHPIAGG